MAFTTIASFEVPLGHVAIVTSIDQTLESTLAYDDCIVRIAYRGSEDEFWFPDKPEVTPVRIALFENEIIELQVENNGVVNHFCDADICGYLYEQQNKGPKNQRGLRIRLGLPQRKSLPPIPTTT